MSSHLSIAISTDKLARGGKEKQLLLLAKGLLDRGHDVKVITKHPIDPINTYNEIEFPAERIESFGEGISYLMKSRFTRIISRFTPDVILNFDLRTSLWCERFPGKLRNIPTVNCIIRGGIPPSTIKSKILFSMSLKRSRFIVANSVAGLSAHKLQETDYHRVIYNGIDVERFSASKPFSYAELFSNQAVAHPIYIANVASLYKHKGQITLIEALKKVKHQHVYAVLIGEGPERNALEKRIYDLGLSERVHIVGRQTNLARYLNSADLFVNTSWSEGCSNAILEAMACKLPVISTKTGGTPEIVHLESTQFFETQNADDLAAKITAAIDKGLQHSSAAYDWVSKFSIQNMVDQYESFIQKKVIVEG